MRYESFVKKLVDQISKGGQIRLLDMPDLDLYMDQVTTFMNDKLSIYKREDKDKILTKTMINNYTKHNIIPKPVNKKYSKDHLLFLILIYHMKGIVSIKDMEHLMAPLIQNYNSELEEKINIEDIYSILQEIQKDERDKLDLKIQDDIEKVKEYLKEMDMQDDDILEIFMLTVMLTVRANMQKYLAERIIDEFFIYKAVPQKKEKR
ncbi:MAG: DUF1836 domain-containing protein, partial [Clostridia bacterium]|nr:DUF1836 domain-containing protein [Clostridia bacterium]